MIKNYYALLLGCLLFTILRTNGQTIDQFRGPERNGIYPEKDLLDTWPPEGPALVLTIDSIGNGYSSPVVTKSMIYLSGEIDSIGYLFAFDHQGKLAWKRETGKEWTKNFPGPRSSATVVDDLLYFCSSMGKVMCFTASGGELKWTVDMVNDLHGINIRFAYTESILVDGDVLFCSPGGRDTNVVALNRFTGKMIWKSTAMADSAAYCSPVIFSHHGRKAFSTLTIHHLIGLDAATGELLWSQRFERPNDIHCNTPWYDNGDLYVNDRGGNGMVRLKLGEDGKSFTEAWRNFKGGNVQSGFIKLGNYLYGSRYRPARFESIDVQTGEAVDSLKFAVASTIFTDGHLYCYGEDGTMGLMKPENGKITLVSSFKITEGTKEHFAHPAIRDGILYVRHGNTMMAYDIRKKK